MRRILAALAGAVVLFGMAPTGIPMPGGGQMALAAEYTLATVANYAIEPAAARIAVSVQVTFTNTTPDPAGQFSVFEVVDVAIHSGATSVTAEDSQGGMQVAVATRNGVNVASVRARTPVRYNQKATFTLTYLLPDGASIDVRVRPSAIVFPAWSFGTSGEVTITLPGEYEVRVDGDDLSAEQDGAVLRLESGAVDDPSSWLARVTAVSPTSYTTLSQGVVLTSGTVDLQVRAWVDDEAWGEATLAVMVEALPLLEAQIGLEYPRVGPLVVVESVPDLPGALSEPAAAGGEMAIAFDAPAFTALHQAAHVWLSDQLAADRWIREGFASQAAVAVAAAAGLEAPLPYDPAARAVELAAAAFPLMSWGAGEATIEQDAWAYAASWGLANRLAAAIGDDALRAAWRRIAAGVGAYEALDDEPPPPGGGPVTPADSRRLLDQLEAVSGVDLAAVFAENVFDASAAAELPQRASAREAYAALLTAAGEWGAPDPVRAELSGWRFDEAEVSIAEAIVWLAARDELLVAIEAAGLTTPERLRDRYRTAGGGPDAQAELAAESAFVGGYADVRDHLAEEPSIVKRVGLLGGTEPSALLDDAAALFAAGDLRGAAEAVDAARARLDGAAADGLVRLVSAAVVLILVLALAVLVRRRRRGSGYTAPP
ncbi:MAG TPA: hypothetical protein VEW45_04850 [Candidatus Dormibacteraeota bacterium]|nr:hypothetical protein [Candidatus Dormibacteraeota bacterium]